MNQRTILLWAGVLGATGVALGAFGAHALKGLLLERGMTNAWDTAVRYHLLHAVALVALAGWARAEPKGGAAAGWAARLWVAGTAVFAGSLYALALGGPRWLGPVTPLGGLALIGGWVCVVVAALAKTED